MAKGEKIVILSVIIPAYREAKNLKVLLPRLKKILTTLSVESEILIIDTKQSMDNTEKLCALNRVKYFKREADNAYGSAIRTGIQKASGKYILFMDSDGSHLPEFILKMFPFVKEFDVVIASRYVAGGETENSKILILMSKIVNIIYSLVLAINCKDVSNSFKIYRARDIQSLNLKCNNFDVVEEILYKVCRNKKNIKIKEVPCVFKKRMHGTTKRNLFLFMLSYMFTLIRLRLMK